MGGIAIGEVGEGGNPVKTHDEMGGQTGATRANLIPIAQRAILAVGTRIRPDINILRAPQSGAYVNVEAPFEVKRYPTKVSH